MWRTLSRSVRTSVTALGIPTVTAADLWVPGRSSGLVRDRIGSPHLSCGLGSAPPVVFLAADAGAFAALGGEDVGVVGVGIAPPQMCLQHQMPDALRAAPDRASTAGGAAGPGLG